jgi:phosphoketolase
VHDGAVLPILHLNGYKIAGPAVLARVPRDELEALFRGYGYTPYFVEGGDPMKMHQLMAATLDAIVADIRRIQRDARTKGFKTRDVLFTTEKPIIFAYHGYPTLIHRLTYRRTNHSNLHVRGYKEEGTTTTPFDMVVLNDLDRFHLVMDVIDRVPKLGPSAAYIKQLLSEKLVEHKRYIAEHGEDMPEIRNWKWGAAK